MTRLRPYALALGVLALVGLGVPALACPFCAQERGRTLVDDFAKAQVVVYDAIRKLGTQKSVVPYMQTRDELYEVLGYHAYESKLDELFGKKS